MPKKSVTYKEPSNYFSPGMRKVAEEWDKAHANDGKAPAAGKAPKGKAPAAGKAPKGKAPAAGKAPKGKAPAAGKGAGKKK